MSDGPQYPSYPGSDQPQGQQPPPPGYGQAPQGPPAYGQPAYGQPPYGQPMYGPPAYGYGYQAPPRTNGKAMWGMIVGIISIAFCYLGVLIGPVAIVLSVLGKKDIKQSNGTQTGEGMATAGLVTGIAGTLVQGAFTTLVIVSEVYNW